MVESWIAPLEAGDPDAAWDLLIERYRRLIFGAIRHYTTEHDDVMDVFAWVCASNLTIDWFRHRDGRPRLHALAAALPPPGGASSNTSSSSSGPTWKSLAGPENRGSRRFGS